MPLEQVAMIALLCQQVLCAVLAHHLDSRLREHGQLADRDVLDGGADAHVAGIAARCGDPLAHAREVVAYPRGSQPAEGHSLSHAMPPCRPVTPLSRRCEKNSSGWQLVQ